MPNDTHKRLVLLACILGSGIALLDSTIVNVALPTIQRELGGGLAAQQWIIDGYLLTLGSLLLVGGSLGDLYGERRIFTVGVATFGLTSLLCAFAPDVNVLIAARILQGVSGALLTPSALAVIISTFDGEERGTAIGTWTAWSGIATVIGPLAGGWLVDVASWRWIFAVNVPFVIATVAILEVALPKQAVGTKHARIDFLGAILCALGLAGPVFALIEEPRLGWTHPGVLGPLLAGLALLGWFFLHERRAPAPMLPLSLFSTRNFSVGNAETLVVYAALSTMFFFLAIFLQQVAGYSALKTGVALLPVTVVMFVLSRRFGTLSARFGPRLFMGAGPLVSAVGVLLLLRLDAHIDYAAELLPALVVFSLGLAMTVAPLTMTVLADARQGNAGIASAVNNAIARVAGLIGIAVVGVAVAGRSGGGLDTAGFHLGMVVTAALVAAGGIMGAIGIRTPAASPVLDSPAPLG